MTFAHWIALAVMCTAVSAAWADRANGPDTDALARIELPAHPDEEDVAVYVGKIAALTENQSSFSSTDPQIEMLMRAGRYYPQVLLDFQNTRLSFYARRALDQIIDDSHKQLVIDNLRAHPTLITLVNEHGWESDAKPVLLAELRNPTQYLSPQWITALTKLSDPSTYDALADYLADGPNPSYTYHVICDLPGIELDAAVAKAWRRHADSPSIYMRGQMAEIAIRHGHIDALGALIELAANPEARFTFNGKRPRQIVDEHIEQTGDDEALLRWYEQHKDRIFYNAVRKKYYVQKQLVG